MKLLAICGSPRKDQSTQWALEQCLEAAREAQPDLQTELVLLCHKTIGGCTSCGACAKKLTCSIQDDFIPLMQKLEDPELSGLLLGSPVYMGGMTSQLKAFLDRTVSFRRNGFMFQRLVGGALTIGGSRNGGQDLTLQNIHAAMMIHDMMIVGDGGATAHFGGSGWAKVDGGYQEDSVALDTYRNLGRRMANTIARLRD